MNPWAKRSLAIVAAIGAHEALARGLDRAGLVERLLSPSGAGAAVVLVAAAAMYALRLGLLFVVPGVVVARAVNAALGRYSASRRARSRASSASAASARVGQGD